MKLKYVLKQLVFNFYFKPLKRLICLYKKSSNSLWDIEKYSHILFVIDVQSFFSLLEVTGKQDVVVVTQRLFHPGKLPL